MRIMAREASPAPGGSILSTSAPISARRSVATGPGKRRVRSRTRRPCKAGVDTRVTPGGESGDVVKVNRRIRIDCAAREVRASADLLEFFVRFEPFGFERLEARLDVGLTADRVGQTRLLLGLVAGRVGDETVQRAFLGIERVHFLFDLADLRLQRLLQMRKTLARFRFLTTLFLAVDARVGAIQFAGRIPRVAGCRRLERRALLGRVLEQPVAVVVEIAVERLQPVFGDQHELVGGRAQQMAIVRHQNERAFELRERHGQGVTRFEVEVVGRFVEQQQIGLLPDDEREREACFFTARKGRDGRRGHFAGEIEAAEEIAQFLLARVGREAREMLERRVVGAQRLELMLRKIADLQAFARARLARKRRERARERLDQRRFTLAVRAQQPDALAVLYGQRHTLDDRRFGAVFGAIAAAHVFHHEHGIGRGIGRAELESERRGGMRGRDQLHLFERLHTALRLARLGGLGLEAVNEALQMRDGFLLLFVGALLQRELLCAQDLELRIVAAVAFDLLIFQMQRDVADCVEEFAVVRNDDKRARIAMQPVFEPDDGVEVQVVRGFVEQQQVGAAHQRLREIQAHAPAAREARHGLARLVEREAEAEQQRFGARGRGVAVGVGERGVGFGFGRAVVGRRGRRNARFDLAQVGVAVERVFERAPVDRGRFLRHVRDLPRRRQREVAGVRVQFAAQHGEQRGFARAVRADETGLFTRIQGERGLVEKRLGAASKAELVEADHGSAGADGAANKT
ncbi:hypothetical protein PT2222_50316 [Paraburkholderia tropica]